MKLSTGNENLLTKCVKSSLFLCQWHMYSFFFLMLQRPPPLLLINLCHEQQAVQLLVIQIHHGYLKTRAFSLLSLPFNLRRLTIGFMNFFCHCEFIALFIAFLL